MSIKILIQGQVNDDFSFSIDRTSEPQEYMNSSLSKSGCDCVKDPLNYSVNRCKCGRIGRIQISKTKS